MGPQSTVGGRRDNTAVVSRSNIGGGNGNHAWGDRPAHVLNAKGHLSRTWFSDTVIGGTPAIEVRHYLQTPLVLRLPGKLPVPNRSPLFPAVVLMGVEAVHVGPAQSLLPLIRLLMFMSHLLHIPGGGDGARKTMSRICLGFGTNRIPRRSGD